MFNAAEYAQQLATLMPRGKLWDSLSSVGSFFSALLDGLSKEFARVDSRADQLRLEASPHTSTELLPDWEAFAGLPECGATQLTLQERRAAVVEKITYNGDTSIAGIQALASKLGYVIDIIEYKAFVCGLSPLGITPLNSVEFRFIWRVKVPEARVTTFKCGQSQLGVDPLLNIRRADDLECILKMIKPSHTKLFFDYKGV